MSFPIINSLDDILPKIADKPEIRCNKQSNGTYIVCYTISGPDTFDNPWARECRGITFDRDGRIASRTMHKFFNVNEKPWTQFDELDWDRVVRVMDKLDGSMISTLTMDDRVWAKSKKSFDSAVAVKAQAFLDSHSNYTAFAMYINGLGYTPTFEYTAPDNRIVLPYDEEGLTLLHVRNNVTGEYWCYDKLSNFAGYYQIPLVGGNFDRYQMSVEDYVKSITAEQWIEGVVVQFANGDMVKVKTDQYIAMHRTITFVRERDVAEMILSENIDDLKAPLKDLGIDLSKIEAIETRIVNEISKIRSEVELAVSAMPGASAKDVALKYNGHPYFGLIMNTFNGKDPKYEDWFKTNRMKEMFSLDQI